MIQATPPRLSFAPEWFTMATWCAATGIVGLLAIRELRVVPPAFAGRPAVTSAIAAPAMVAPEAVSIPTLVVGGQDLRVGDSAAEAIARMSASATLAATADERGPLGAREVRSYQLDGANVIVVLEPFEKRGPLRVAAIYLQ